MIVWRLIAVKILECWVLVYDLNAIVYRGKYVVIFFYEVMHTNLNTMIESAPKILDVDLRPYRMLKKITQYA